MARNDNVRLEGRDPLELVLAAINTSQAELRELREEVRGAQEDTAAKLAALKTERPYSFRKKGHEEQYVFNSAVNSKIAEAGLQLARVERGVADGAAKVALDAAKEALTKGEQLMAQRQKLIKVADRSELGWAVVAEYQADDLAENSDDGRKLERAEKAAERKVAAKRRKLDTARGQTLAQAVSGKKEPFTAASSSAPAAAARVGSVDARRPIVCFGCGLTGHMRRECPKRSPLVTGMYPSAIPLYLDGVVSCHVGAGADSWTEHDPNVGRCWEFQLGESQPVSVKGRLRQHVQFWVDTLCAPGWIVDLIREGYVIPFYSEPTAHARPNQQSARGNAGFVDLAVAELLSGGYIESVSTKPYICSPLSVVENATGKQRLVLNLRHVNQFVWKQKFKYEDLRIAMMLFRPSEYMFTFDLKSGYHHVEVTQAHRKYLGFEWNGRYFQFSVLPFGLSSAPYVFSKLMRVLVRRWRSKGLKAIMYLDDGICAVKGKAEAERASAWVRDTLDCAGLVVHGGKSVWLPALSATWLGFDVDLERGCGKFPKPSWQHCVLCCRPGY